MPDEPLDEELDEEHHCGTKLVITRPEGTVVCPSCLEIVR